MLCRAGAPAGVLGSSKEVCGVKRARPSVFRIVDFKHQRLVAAHLGKIIPAMIGVVFQSISLPDPVRVAALGDDQIFHRDALGVGQREGIGLDRLIDRAPNLNDREAAGQ